MKVNGYNLNFNAEIKKLLNNYDEERYAPKFNEIFRALELTSLENVKVVILGQDPYPTPGDACGLSFSVNRSEKLPKSLVNINKELKSDLNIENLNGDLSYWAEQGVLLLNTVFTVEKCCANSHRNIGWLEVSDSIIAEINKKENIVFVLLGKQAQNYEKKITNKNIIIKAPHPSPLSAYRGFLGQKYLVR